MPRVKGRGALERTALADVFKHTLSRIPTTFGRLVYLAGLRDSNSGTYKHHGLSSTFGRQESMEALAESHSRVFQEWLRIPLAEKHAELKAYFSQVEEPETNIVRHWRGSRVYWTHIPEGASPAEKELFLKDLELLLELFSSAGGAAPGQATSRLE